MIKLLDELLKNSFENIVKVKVNTGNKEQLVLTALYCSIVDLSDAFLALVHQEKTTGSLSVIRTLSETYVDLINLDKHSGYYDSMLLEYYQQQSKYLKNSKNGNKYLESLKSIGDINSEVSRVDDIITSLKKKKVRQFKIKEKFEMAGMQDEYYSVYLQLCGESHGNLEALISRHFHEIDDNLVICVGGDSSRWIECYILFLLHILINSGRVFFKSLDGHSKLIFENLVEKINTELKNTK